MSKKRKPKVNRKQNDASKTAQVPVPHEPRPALLLVADPEVASPALIVEPPVPRRGVDLCPGPDDSLAKIEVPCGLESGDGQDADPGRGSLVPASVSGAHAAPELAARPTEAAIPQEPVPVLPWPSPERRKTLRWVAGLILSAATVLLVLGGVRAAGACRAKLPAADYQHAAAANPTSWFAHTQAERSRR